MKPAKRAEPDDGQAVLATWRMALDESRALDGEPYLQATARPAGRPDEPAHRRQLPDLGRWPDQQ